MNETDERAQARRVERLLQRPVTAFSRVGGGGNSRVFAIRSGSKRFVVKQYFSRTDGRHPGRAEFDGLTFLWRHGFRDVPRPIAANAHRDIAVYEFVVGSPVGRVGATDVNGAVAFLARLHALAQRDGGVRLSPASEACFCVDDIRRSLERRLRRLDEAAVTSGEHGRMRRFLARDFARAYADVARWAEPRVAGTGFGVRRRLPRALRTLSPSDFGFHNALRRRDGSLVFLDFEYFGWDDPAKMAVDFLWHPAMTLTDALRRRFIQGLVAAFPGDPGLKRRIELVWPLYGLKWCLILLNEFVPADLSRRRFANTDRIRSGVVRTRQLRKAERLLEDIVSRYERFPYHE